MFVLKRNNFGDGGTRVIMLYMLFWTYNRIDATLFYLCLRFTNDVKLGIKT